MQWQTRYNHFHSVVSELSGTLQVVYQKSKRDIIFEDRFYDTYAIGWFSITRKKLKVNCFQIFVDKLVPTDKTW